MEWEAEMEAPVEWKAEMEAADEGEAEMEVRRLSYGNTAAINTVGGMGWDGIGLRPPPVLTDPGAPCPEGLWQTCQVVSGCPKLHLGLQGHHRSWATQAQ